MKKILYVDDSPEDLELAQRGFDDTDMQLVCVESAKHAMPLLRRDPSEWLLVVTDLMMPTDGLYFAKKLEEHELNVPIAFISGEEPMAKLFEQYTGLKNYKGFISKPLTPEKARKVMGSADATG